MPSIPLHPLLVHFPIAFLFIGSIVQLIALWKKKLFDRLAFFLIGFGWIMGCITYLTGDAAARYAVKEWGPQIRSSVEIHQTFATITLLVYGALLALKIAVYGIEFMGWDRFGIKRIPFLKTLLLVLALAGGVFITLTGHYGGKMVYQEPSQSMVQGH